VSKESPRLEAPSGPSPWDSFETSKEEPALHLPDWLARAFNGLMIFLLLAIVFCVCGALTFLAAYKMPAAATFALSEGAVSAWVRFALGGLVGTGLLVLWLLRKPSNY